MRILATLIIFLTLPTPRLLPPVAPLPVQTAAASSHPHGVWYMAENGHAVYCYGPVKVIDDPVTGMHRVATFCKGDQVVVPLKD
jgi:hypothetical protein